MMEKKVRYLPKAVSIRQEDYNRIKEHLAKNMTPFSPWIVQAGLEKLERETTKGRSNDRP